MYQETEESKLDVRIIVDIAKKRGKRKISGKNLTKKYINIQRSESQTLKMKDRKRIIQRGI